MLKLQAKRRDVIAMPVVFVLLTLLCWTLMEGGLALGFALIWPMAVIASFCYLRGSLVWQSSASAWICLGGALLLTPVYFLSSWWGLTILVFLFQGACWLFWMALVTGRGGSHSKLTDLLPAVFILIMAPISGLFEFGESLGDYHKRRVQEKAQRSPNKHPFPWGIVGGIVLAIPALAILGSILSSADAAFSGMMSTIGETIGNFFEDLLDGMETLIASLVIALIFFYPVTGMLFQLRSTTEEETNTRFEVLPGTLLVGFYGSICLLCLTYLLAQLSYLFNGFMGVLPEGMTAAEYARRGFFEILAFSILALLLIGIGLFLAKKDRLSPVLNGMIFFLCGFTLLLISTAFAKMLLYVRLYGLTVKRITVTAFLLFLTVVFVTVILGRIMKKFKSLPVVLAAAILLFGVVSYIDPHRLAAEYNVAAWEYGRLSSVDVELLGDLSDSAIPALIRVYESEDFKASEAAKKELQQIYLEKCDDYGLDDGSKLPASEDVFSYHLAEHAANNAINEILDGLWEETAS